MKTLLTILVATLAGSQAFAADLSRWEQRQKEREYNYEESVKKKPFNALWFSALGGLQILDNDVSTFDVERGENDIEFNSFTDLENGFVLEGVVGFDRHVSEKITLGAQAGLGISFAESFTSFGAEDVRETVTEDASEAGTTRLNDLITSTALDLANISTLNNDDEKLEATNDFIDSTGFQYEENWHAFVGPRVGFAVTPKTLLYVSGGLAVIDLEINGTGAFSNINDDETLFGYYAEIGVDRKLTDMISWTLSGRYTDYGNIETDVTLGEGDNAINIDVDQEFANWQIMTGLKVSLQ